MIKTIEQAKYININIDLQKVSIYLNTLDYRASKRENVSLCIEARTRPVVVSEDDRHWTATSLSVLASMVCATWGHLLPVVWTCVL